MAPPAAAAAPSLPPGNARERSPTPATPSCPGQSPGGRGGWSGGLLDGDVRACASGRSPALVRPPFAGEPRPMGKRDRRHSLKMNRRKAQEKKRIRAKKPKSAKALAAAGAVAAAPAKKARAPKAEK